MKTISEEDQRVLDALQAAVTKELDKKRRLGHTISLSGRMVSRLPLERMRQSRSPISTSHRDHPAKPIERSALSYADSPGQYRHYLMRATGRHRLAPVVGFGVAKLV